MFNKIKQIALLLLVVGLVSCSDNSTNPIKNENPSSMNELANTKTENYNFEVLAYEDTLREGHNVFYIRAYDNKGNSIAKNLFIELTMATGDVLQTTPFSTEIVNIEGNEYLKVDAIFIKPNSEGNEWTLHIESEKNSVHTHIPLNVVASGLVQSFTFNEQSYFVTITSPKSPKVGDNDLVVLVHTINSDMEYETVPDLYITAEPFMPSMGHGSPGDKNLTYMEDGSYVGKANFSMTGDWELRFTVVQGITVIGMPVFKFNVQ